MDCCISGVQNPVAITNRAATASARLGRKTGRMGADEMATRGLLSVQGPRKRVEGTSESYLQKDKNSPGVADSHQPSPQSRGPIGKQ